MPYAPLPTVTETLDDLSRRFRATRDPERKRRLHALVLLVSGEATTRKAIAARLDVDRQTVARWLDRYRDGGLGHMLTPSTRGARPGQRTVPAPVLDALKARLNDPAGFGGFHKVQLWLHDEFGLDVPYKSVYTLVRYRLKAKLAGGRPPKVPRPEHPKKASPPRPISPSGCHAAWPRSRRSRSSPSGSSSRTKPASGCTCRDTDA